MRGELPPPRGNPDPVHPHPRIRGAPGHERSSELPQSPTALARASASNAIVYGTGRVSTRQMVREGLGLNLLGVGVITAVCLLMLG